MAGYWCAECEETVPEANYCLSCDSLTASDVIPVRDSDDHDLIEWFSEIALNAGHESVTFDKIRSTHDSYPRPLGGYLRKDEQPQAICDIKKCTIEGVNESSWKASAGVLDSGHVIITDKRVMALLPDDEEPQLIAIPFADIIRAENASSWRSSKLVFEDIEGYQYDLILDTDDETFETISNIVQDLNDRVDSEGSNAAKFLKKIDNEIEASEDAESALHSIATLFEERSEKTHFDEVIAEANSIDELAEGMSGLPNFGTSQELKPEVSSENSSEESGISLSNLQQRISTTAKGADPKDVGKYSLGAILGFGGAAVSAPISTTVGIAALVAGGAATGAYASTHPDSVAGRINPLQLAMDAKSRGSQMGSNSMAGGYGTGAALGTVEHLSQMDDAELDEAYAKWLTEVDIDSVMEGQKAATRHALESDEFDSERQASILGGAAGLAHGYASSGEDFDQEQEDVVGEIVEETDDS